jgi:hypothetical protein
VPRAPAVVAATSRETTEQSPASGALRSLTPPVNVKLTDKPISRRNRVFGTPHAFQRGGALTTAGLSTLLTNALPIAAGMVLFHEPLPSGWIGAVRVAAFAAVVAGAVLLAARGKEAKARLREQELTGFEPIVS